MRPSHFTVALALVALVAGAAAGVGAGVPGSYGARATGDEPWYLLSAISIAEDRNLDIGDELTDRRYEPFHAAGLPDQTKPLEGGRRISPHDPLLPLLLAGPVAAGGWIGAKVALACLAAVLAALVLWTAVRRFDVPIVPAFAATAILAASAPLAVYGSQVYPELPAAILVVTAVALLGGRGSGVAIVAAGLAIVLLPWLSVKYTPLASYLGAYALWVAFRCRGRSATILLAAGFGLAAASFLGLHQLWYGGWTPYATADQLVGGEFTVVGSSPDLIGRSRRLVGLMVDDTFGLAAWQPAYLLAPLALGALVGRRPRHWLLLGGPLAIAWVTATFVALTMQGWWFPGRQLIVALPLATIAVAWWAGRSRVRLLVLAVAGLAGVASYGMLVAEGLRGRLNWVVDFYETGNPWFQAWRRALPDYLDVTGRTWLLHAAWTAGLLALLAYGWRSARVASGAESEDRDGVDGRADPNAGTARNELVRRSL